MFHGLERGLEPVMSLRPMLYTADDTSVSCHYLPDNIASTTTDPGSDYPAADSHSLLAGTELHCYMTEACV